MSDLVFKQKPKRLKHLCCRPQISGLADLGGRIANSPMLIYKFPCKIKLAMKVNSSVGSSNHNECYTVANETLNAYGKWAGCPGGSGPGYSSTMRYVPNENIPGFGPTIGGSICNCGYMYSSPAVNILRPVISGNAVVDSTLTTTNGIWNGFPALTFTYQWYRGGTTPISGATNNTYVIQLVDVGQAITCRVTGTNMNGSSVAISNAITIIGSLNTLTITGFTSGINYQVTYVYSNNTIAPSPVVGGSTIYRFFSTTTTSGSYSSTKNLSPITYLVVAGGGGGGKSVVNGNGGGGGAGGVLPGTGGTINSGTTYQIQVGRGGAGQTSNLQPTGENGVNSSLELNGVTLYAIGGGGGSLGSATPAASGGSGGGSSSNTSIVPSFGGAETAGQGSPGQNVGIGSGQYVAGRGGGATQNGWLGGNGLSSTITGSSGVVYAGGGGGGANNTGTAQVGGLGGGGSGGFLTGSTYTAPTTGTDFLGGGGGGGGGFGNSNNGAKGGSGTVIIRFPSYS
jgi:hypothetical protein